MDFEVRKAKPNRCKAVQQQTVLINHIGAAYVRMYNCINTCMYLCTLKERMNVRLRSCHFHISVEAWQKLIDYDQMHVLSKWKTSEKYQLDCSSLTSKKKI